LVLRSRTTSANLPLLKVLTGLLLTLGATFTWHFYERSKGFQRTLAQADRARRLKRFDLAEDTYLRIIHQSGGVPVTILHLADLHRETGNAAGELRARIMLMTRRAELIERNADKLDSAASARAVDSDSFANIDVLAQLQRIRSLQADAPPASTTAQLVEQCRDAAVAQEMLGRLERGDK
jgi:hypothetical protein